MFDLETALRDWRAHMERGTAMSPREADELEDHLRALIDLELELDGALTPARAFSLARNDICEPTTLSREFAKAARPRWRRLLVAGCGMFAASWFMPALSDATGRLWGWQAFLAAFEWGNPVETLSVLTNILLVLTMYRIGRVRPSKTRWLTWSVTGAAALNLLYWIRVDDLAVGFWAWAGSFVCAASALWMRDREWASAEVRQAPFTGGGGRRQRIRDERGGSGTLILLAAALVASPASAQSWGWYAGPTLGWRDVFEDPRVGLNGGMSLQEFDGHPHLRIDLRFVQRGGDCCGLALSLQMPVLYTTHFSETGYVFVGPAAGYSYYDEHIVDLSAVMGIGSMLARAGSKAIAWEASYSISLPAYWASYYGIETGNPLQGLSLNLMFR